MDPKQREDWIRAAVRALRAGGMEAVRVESLARELGVTKGSFYWHFRDRRALQEAVLARWEEETDQIIAEASRAATPRERLKAFFVGAEQAGERDYPNDSGMFAWAEHDAEAKGRIAATEDRRIGFIEAQLRSAGQDERAVRLGGQVIYLATLGWIERASRVDGITPGLAALVDHLIGLVLTGDAPDATVQANESNP